MRKRKRRWAGPLGAACLAVALLAPAGAQAATTDLSIVKTDSPDPVREGQVLTYTITVTNSGPGAATGVTVTDKLDPQTEFVSATTSQGTCDRKGRTVTCEVGNIGAYSQGVTITIRVRPTQAGTIENVATVEAGKGDTDPNPANNTDTEPTTVTAAGGGGGGGGATCAGRTATIVGTPGPDTLVGTAGRDVIAARGGNDRVRGLGKGDRVCGGGGNDKLKGNAGNDRLKGGRGRDTLRGGGGDDRLAGGPGRDRCFGGPGNDTERSC